MNRPIVRYFGGKWRLAPWIIRNLPEHKVYVEPFGGGGSVLLRKDRAYAEIYNDLDGEIVNVFRVARDHGEKLNELLRLTPFSREEFNQAYLDTDDEIERARRAIIRSFMGYGADSFHRKNGRSGFRSNSNRSHTTPAHDWKNYAECFPQLVDRLRGIVIENRDAKEVMAAHDAPDTLHYVDPPYVHDSRADVRHGYSHEMSDTQHEELAEFLNTLQGQVVVSGYHSELYDRIFTGWKFIEKRALADGARERTEVLWFSPTIKRKGPLI